MDVIIIEWKIAADRIFSGFFRLLGTGCWVKYMVFCWKWSAILFPFLLFFGTLNEMQKDRRGTLSLKKYYLHRTGMVIQHSSWNKNFSSEIRSRWYGICKKWLWFILGPLVAQTIKNLPAVRETQTRSPGQEDPLEKGTATHSSILAWRIPWTEESGGPQPMESQSWMRLSN